MDKVSKDMLIGQLLRTEPGLASILMECGMHCLGCPSSQMESLRDACAVHGIDADAVEEKLNAYLAQKANA